MLILVEREIEGVRMLCPHRGGAPWAALHPDNILEDGWAGFPRANAGLPVVAWSGTPSDDVFGSDPRSFGPAAWDRFEGVCDALAANSVRVVFRPHARHVLCDVPRVVKFLAHRPRERLGVALDAASLLEPSMLPKAADHYRRAFETLGAAADVVWLAGVEVPNSEESPVRSLPLGEGVVDAELIVRLWRENCPEETPVVMVGDSIEEQIGMVDSK